MIELPITGVKKQCDFLSLCRQHTCIIPHIYCSAGFTYYCAMPRMARTCMPVSAAVTDTLLRAQMLTSHPFRL